MTGRAGKYVKTIWHYRSPSASRYDYLRLFSMELITLYIFFRRRFENERTNERKKEKKTIFKVNFFEEQLPFHSGVQYFEGLFHLRTSVIPAFFVNSVFFFYLQKVGRNLQTPRNALKKGISQLCSRLGLILKQRGN